jgi:putative transposase
VITYTTDPEGTFAQMYVQVIFGVKHRACLIHEEWEVNLYKYITGIVQKKNQKLIAINGMPDHLHILIGMKPSCCLSDLIREIKKSSNEFIRESRFTKYNFSWQNGYGAFTSSFSFK